jgi:hypothetical protein
MYLQDTYERPWGVKQPEVMDLRNRSTKKEPPGNQQWAWSNPFLHAPGETSSFLAGAICKTCPEVMV